MTITQPRPNPAQTKDTKRLFEQINGRLPIAPQIYELLRRAIITLAMLPSEALSEKELAQQLGVSRTPVREALIRLADEGLIEILPQRGSFVAPIKLAEVEEAQFIRQALEVAVVRRLATQDTSAFQALARANLDAQKQAVEEGALERFLDLDEAFHRLLCEQAGLPRSWRVIQIVKLQMDRIRYLSLPETGQLQLLLDQHGAIMDAICRGAPDEAGMQLTIHLQEVLRTVRRLSERRPDLF